MSARTPEAEPLLTPAEVATMFRVDPKTVTRWAKAGKLHRSARWGDTGATGRPRFVLCSRASRSSVPSRVSAAEHGEEEARGIAPRQCSRWNSSGGVGGAVPAGQGSSRE